MSYKLTTDSIVESHFMHLLYRRLIKRTFITKIKLSIDLIVEKVLPQSRGLFSQILDIFRLLFQLI